MFLQHALSCHVCHRSLLFIPIKVARNSFFGARELGSNTRGHTRDF